MSLCSANLMMPLFSDPWDDVDYGPQQFWQSAMKQSTWKTFLAAARSVNDESTEDNLRQALKCAEESHGDRSFEAGLCLLELSDYLESVNRNEEADELTERYREILLNLAKDLGLDSRPEA